MLHPAFMTTDLVSMEETDGHRSKKRRTSASSSQPRPFSAIIDVEQTAEDETHSIIVYRPTITPGPKTVYFGMIEANVLANSESIRHLRQKLPATEGCATLELFKANDKTLSCVLGYLEQPRATVLQFLLENQLLEAQAIVCPLPLGRTGCSVNTQPTRIFINIYGSSNLDSAKKLGRALSDNKIYLQHPVYPLAGYLYSNPQLVSRTYDTITEHTVTGGVPIPVTSTQPNVVPVGTTDLFNMFDGLWKEAILSEEPETWKLQTPLLKHQKEGLYFLKRREEGLSIFNVSPYPSAGTVACMKGGILADYMGLGKTLTFLSLIAENPSHRERLDVQTQGPRKQHLQGGTLVIAPLSTLGNWERQINEHVKPGTLSYYVFHGVQRRNGGNTLHEHDVVFTSYDVVSQEWKSQKNNKKESSLHGINWFRIVLDEAHEIRTEKTQRAEAVYALSSSRRWCVTGTPIHNHLGDLASLFRFLQYSPLHTKAGFERYVVSAGEKGMDNLRSALRAVCLRRVKTSVSEIQLPDRSESLHYLELSHDERVLYESQLQELSLSDRRSIWGRKSAEKIKIWLKLRQICVFGENLPPTNNVRGFDNPHCIGCGAAAFDPRNMDIDNGTESLGCPHRTICNACAQVFPTEVAIEGKLDAGCEKCLSMQSPTPAAVENYYGPSTKVKALLGAIQEVEPHLLCPPKHVVFSTWTRLLDLIAIELNLVGIDYCRLDGTMDLRCRNKTIEDFHSSNTKRVMLISLTAGGVGINLTCASRVHMMEPHWNPQIENQAIERVHRLGQKNPVTIVRYIIRDSIEIDVRNRQKGKLELAHSSLAISTSKHIDESSDNSGIESTV